jgi:hypothetical protein
MGDCPETNDPDPIGPARAHEPLERDPLLEMERAEGASLARLGAWQEHQRRQLALPRPRCTLVPIENWSSEGNPVEDLRAFAERVERESREPLRPFEHDPVLLAACRRIRRGLQAERERAIFGWQLPRLGRYSSIRRRLRAELLWRASWLALSMAAISAAMVLAAWH